jgi:putative membrane protein
VIGIIVLGIFFVVIDKLTPYHLWTEIVDKKNVALAIVLGSMCIAVGLIIAAAVHG